MPKTTDSATVPPRSPAKAVADDRYLTLAQLVAYSGLSDKTLRRAMQNADHRLTSYRVGKRRLVRRSDFDRWIEVQQPDTSAEDALAAQARAAVKAIRGEE